MIKIIFVSALFLGFYSLLAQVDTLKHQVGFSVGTLYLGKKNGLWTYHIGNEIKNKSTFKNDTLDGFYISYYKYPIECFKGYFYKGLKQGNWSYYNWNGNLTKLIYFINDKVDEISYEYDTLGIIVGKQLYKNGVLINAYKLYSNKNLEYKLYKNSRLTIYYPDGSLKKKLKIINFLQEGKRIDYFTNGVISLKGIYRQGDRIGTWRFYHKNGQIKAIGSYIGNAKIIDCWEEGQDEGYGIKVSAKIGEWKYYDEKGNLISKKLYDHFYDTQDGDDTIYFK